MPSAVLPPPAAGSNPKDATERRAMQSGTSFVTGLLLTHTLLQLSCQLLLSTIH